MSSLFALVLGLVAGPTCYPPPVDAPVVDPFRAPACVYCPGNRGIEFGPRPGTPVRALAAGLVTFAGTVAGTRYVVVLGDDGVRVTYGRLATAAVVAHRRVVAGQSIGTSTDRFLLAFRDGLGERYLDPTPHLGVVHSTPRLVPLDGTRPRPVPAAALRCERGGRR